MGRKRFILIVSLFLSGSIPSAAQVQTRSLSKIVERGLPIVFEPAAPGRDNSTSMIGRVSGGMVGFRPSAIDIYMDKRSGGFEVNFDGARRVAPSGVDLEQSQSNYLLGDNPALWRTHVSNYTKVVYSGLYPGIDVVFYGNGDHLEHDFIVSGVRTTGRSACVFPAAPGLNWTKAAPST